jgi:hypothetical protein
MANTIGKMIGVVYHSFKTTLDNGESVTIKMGFDFANVPDNEVKAWLVSNRVIAFQRPARGLSVAELEALDGTTIQAGDAGKKIVSKREKILAGIKVLREMGMDDQADELEKKLEESENENE